MLDMSLFAKTVEHTGKRQSEKEGTKYLLKNLFPEKDIHLDYAPNKKPFLRNDKAHISISHSHDQLVILINKKEQTGVDVELIRDKVKNVQHKFLSEEELKWAGNNVELLTILWAAKEAVFKVDGFENISFSRHITIESFDSNNNEFYGNIMMENHKKRYLLKREKHGNYILVYVLHEV